ncbi:MAG: SH3 domain-containing protein [bacterium]
MSRKKIIVLSALVAICMAASAAHAAKQLSVQVREVPVKAQANYMSATVGTLPYGAGVEVTGEDGNWYQISQPHGFIPKNATGTAKPSVDAGKNYAAKGVSHDETALAGKGFNPQVEGQYKKDNAQLAAAYAQVDRMERTTVSQGELNQFIASGKLNK